MKGDEYVWLIEKEVATRYELDKGGSVHTLRYHLVQMVEYRKEILQNGVVDLLKQKVRETSGSFEVEVLSLG